ncbi:MAG: hypothetical protein Q4F97_10620 [Bacteroidales bacterium]|nr:hypothetical protein [Bacteroidales bacterium]
MSLSKKVIYRFFNCYWAKALWMERKYFTGEKMADFQPMIISSIDGRRNMLGLTDRFKGIVTCYALSKVQNIPYKCNFTHPFNLDQILVPNKYDWTVKENQLTNYRNDAKIIILRKSPTLKPLLRYFPIKKQLHVYANFDYLDEINRRYNTNFTFGALFNELFKPSEELQQQIDHHLNQIGEPFVACVFRFQSLLNDFKEYKFKNINDEQLREMLIKKNVDAVKKIINMTNKKVLVTSDSITFLKEISKVEGVYTLPGEIVHMGCTFDKSTSVYMKSFLDFYMLSNADEVYSIGTKEMYNTQFPRYAALLGNVPFQRIRVA